MEAERPVEPERSVEYAKSEMMEDARVARDARPESREHATVDATVDVPVSEPAAPALPEVPSVPETFLDEKAPVATLARLDRPIRVDIHVNLPQIQLRTIITGRNAADVVTKMKARAASELSWRDQLMLWPMPALVFARHLVQRHNVIAFINIPAPVSCEDFLRKWEAQGFVTIVQAE